MNETMRRFWLVVCFVGGLFLAPVVIGVCAGQGIQWYTLLRFGFLSFLLFGGVWLLLKNRDWGEARMVFVLTVALGFVVGLFLVAFVRLEWNGAGAGGNILVAQTIAALLTAGILLATLGLVARYTTAAQEQVEMELRARTGLFVVDPIWTVKEYGCHLAEHGGRRINDKEDSENTPTYPFIKPCWLAIEIVNEGKFPAVNIALEARWISDTGPSAEQRGNMQPAPQCTSQIIPTLEKLEKEYAQWGNEFKVWRRWDLPPGKSILACLPPPKKTVCGDKLVLELTWWDPSYEQWAPSKIRVNRQTERHEDEGKWTTDWAEVRPRARVQPGR